MNIPQGIREAKSVGHMFKARCEATPALIAYEVQDEEGVWHAFTFSEYYQQVKKAALGLHSFGINKGSCVAVWGNTTPEWTILDLATISLGAHVAGIYQTSTPEQSAYIINDSGATVLCCDSMERLNSILEIRDQIPNVVKFVVWSGSVQEDDAVTSMATLYEDGDKLLKENPEEFDKILDEVDFGTYANLVYTSGTTGHPKGVVLTNGNCVSVGINACDHAEFFDENDTTISYLPLSHVAEYMSFMTRLICGVRAYFVDEFHKMPPTIGEKKPTVLLGVPRVYEKIHEKIIQSVENGPPTARKIFYWAENVGRRVVQHKQEGKSVPPLLAIQHSIAESMVFSKIRGRLGGNLRVMFSGAAPMDPKLIEFYSAIGVTFLEAYGLSETTGASHVNLPHDIRIGWVGQPIKGVEQKIAEDGEILLRGPSIFSGYLNREDATREALDEDGWFHTGDIGEIDDDGFLRITDRKKNLLITAGGKNVAPAGIETLIKREHCISQVVVIGDRMKFLTALITPNIEYIEANGLSEDEVKERVEKVIADTNTQIARYEQVRKFRILPREFTIEDGEVTPTMKLKRNVIIEHWKDLVDEMYAEAPTEAPAGKSNPQETVNA